VVVYEYFLQNKRMMMTLSGILTPCLGARQRTPVRAAVGRSRRNKTRRVRMKKMDLKVGRRARRRRPKRRT
jgi:hypothetical protein